MLKALHILTKISTNSTIKEKSARLKLDFPEIKEIQITKEHFDKIHESRKTIAYSEAIKIAKMIILNYSPDIKNGQENMLALLFDMNKLWEEFIFRMLQRSKKPNYKVEFQNSQRFWENKTIRPDLVVTKTDVIPNEKFVIDTKWKIIDYQNPSDDDLKQMFAYNLYWESSKSMLLYPKVYDYDEKFGEFHFRKNGPNQCKLAFVDVMDSEGNLDFGIGDVILEKLSSNT